MCVFERVSENYTSCLYEMFRLQIFKLFLKLFQLGSDVVNVERIILKTYMAITVLDQRGRDLGRRIGQ